MSDSTRKMEAGESLFAFSEGEGKFFHLQWAIMSAPIYPHHPAAFKLAADMILDSHQAAQGPENNDSLLFPVLYLYRHCLELKLKELLFLGIRFRFFDDQTTEKMLDEKKGLVGKHDLLRLWEMARVFLEHRYPKDDQIPIAESRIKEMHEIDPTGQMLRYDRERGTWARLPYDRIFPPVIGIAHLRQMMDELYCFLDTCYGHTLDYWQEDRP
jgi:hypothetical protein